MTEQQFLSELGKAAAQSDARNKTARVIMAFVYTNPLKFNLHMMDEDSRSDFILWMYPKFVRVLHDYNAEKGSLVTYLQSVVYWSCKTWKKRDAADTAYNRAVNNYIAAEYEYKEEHNILYATEPSAAYRRPVGHAPAKKRRGFTPHRILVAALKACYYLEPEHIRKISGATGYTEEYIHSCAETLRSSILRKTDAIAQAGQQCGAYYMRLCRYSYEMKQLDPCTVRYVTLRDRYIRTEKKWKKLCKTIRTMPRCPSDRKIAEILHIKRSSVEAALSFVRKKYAGYTAPSENEPAGIRSKQENVMTETGKKRIVVQ